MLEAAGASLPGADPGAVDAHLGQALAGSTPRWRWGTQLPPQTVAMLHGAVQEVQWPRRRAAASTSPETSAERTRGGDRLPVVGHRVDGLDRETCASRSRGGTRRCRGGRAQGEAGSDHEVARSKRSSSRSQKSSALHWLTSRVKLTTTRGRCRGDEPLALLVEGGQLGGTLPGRGRRWDGLEGDRHGNAADLAGRRHGACQQPLVAAGGRRRRPRWCRPREAATVRAPAEGVLQGHRHRFIPASPLPVSRHDLRGPEAEAGHLADGDESPRANAPGSPPGEGRRPPGQEDGCPLRTRVTAGGPRRLGRKLTATQGGAARGGVLELPQLVDGVGVGDLQRAVSGALQPAEQAPTPSASPRSLARPHEGPLAALDLEVGLGTLRAGSRSARAHDQGGAGLALDLLPAPGQVVEVLALVRTAECIGGSGRSRRRTGGAPPAPCSASSRRRRRRG